MNNSARGDSLNTKLGENAVGPTLREVIQCISDAQRGRVIGGIRYILDDVAVSASPISDGLLIGSSGRGIRENQS